MSTEAIVNLDHVTVLQQSNTVLSNVSLTIKKSEFVYLIGKTGSGKSSLLKTLYGELLINKGRGSICSYDLTKLQRKDIPALRRKLGIIFQDFQLLTDRSIRENLLFVLKATGWTDRGAMDARIQEVLNKVGLANKSLKLPHELSGGEQQRVSIARALLNDPELVLADEPTGNLDPDTSEDIMRLLFEISKSGRAIVMATHNYPLIERFPSRVVRCLEGTVQDLVPHQ